MVAGKMIQGSPKEIAEKITQLVGDRHVSVFMVEESASSNTTERVSKINEWLSELEKMAVNVGHVDDSREAIYARTDSE